MFSAVILDKGDFYRLALLFNGKAIRFVFGAGSHFFAPALLSVVAITVIQLRSHFSHNTNV